jgi:outer membrane protein
MKLSSIAGAIVVGLLAATSSGQEAVTVSARAGQRRPVALPAPEADGIHLSLERATAIALANNSDLEVAVDAAEAGQYSLMGARGIFDPLASLSAQHQDSQSPTSTQLAGASVLAQKTDTVNLSVSQEVPTGGLFALSLDNQKQKTNSTFFTVNPSYTVNGNLHFQQPLLRNFGLGPTLRLIRTARNTRDASYQQVRSSIMSTIDSVDQAYWDLVYARENLRVKEEAKSLAEDLRHITQVKIEVGSQAPIDIVQTDAAVAQREEDIIVAQGQIGDAEDRLKRLLNFDREGKWDAHIIPTDEVRMAERPAIDVGGGVASALRSRPDIQASLFNLQSSFINYRFQKNQLLPQLNVSVDYGYAGLGGTFTQRDADGNVVATFPGDYWDALYQVRDTKFRNWTAALTFSFPIGNRAARGAFGVARFNLEQAQAAYQSQRQDVVVQVRAAARAIDTAEKSIDAATKNRELQEKNVDAEKKKYDNGMVTSYEVLQTQNDLSAARSSELQALTVYRKALSAYHLSVGDMLAWKGIRIEGAPEGAAPPAPERLSGGRR